MPSISAKPRVGRISLVKRRLVVVLPEPFGPRNPSTVPGSTSRPSGANVSPYCVVRSGERITIPSMAPNGRPAQTIGGETAWQAGGGRATVLRMDDAVVSVMYGTTMRGLPNHHRIAGAEFLGETVTAPIYRLLTVAGAYPLLLPTDGGDGVAVPCERYRIPRAMWEAKVAAEPDGLVVGKIVLADGTAVIGMLADESWLTGRVDVEDITQHGGWAAYAASI